MIPRNLLSLTWDRAMGIIPYGQAGTKKTLTMHTGPFPVMVHDFEGGAVCLMPWARRSRQWTHQWTTHSQEDRQKAFNLLTEDNRKDTLIQPAPLIDVVWYDNLNVGALEHFTEQIGSFNYEAYNMLAIDPIMELSVASQTFSKGPGQEMAPMTLNLWSGAQERVALRLRKLRNYRDMGVFIYITSGEQIDKDYVTDPRSKKQGEAPAEPYSVKGTVWVPGQLVNTMAHLTDLLLHARQLGGKPVWVTVPEPISQGIAHWETKDRTGRLSESHMKPNLARMLNMIYGVEGRQAIYAVCKDVAKISESTLIEQPQPTIEKDTNEKPTV